MQENKLISFAGIHLNCAEDLMMYISDQSYLNPWYPEDDRASMCIPKTTTTDTTECIFYCQGSASIKDVFIWVPPGVQPGASTRLTDVKIN